MKSDVSKSLNKFFEDCFNVGASHGLIPPGTKLIFDLYERVKEYPKAMIRVKDVDTLDHAWRTTSTVSFKIFVDGNDIELLNQLSNYAIRVIQDNYMAIPIFNYVKVISDSSNPAIQAGERVLPSNDGKLFLRKKPTRVFKNYNPYLEESLIIYIYDYVKDREIDELKDGVDYDFDFKTGEIKFKHPIVINDDCEIRAFYVYREFVKIGKIVPDTLLEIPMYIGDSSAPGTLTSEIIFHFIS